jgi:hypothetical protein
LRLGFATADNNWAHSASMVPCVSNSSYQFGYFPIRLYCPYPAFTVRMTITPVVSRELGCA